MKLIPPGFAIVLIQSALSIGLISDCSAQYFRITRGQPCPFDTCAAIDVKQYRRETAFMRETQSLIRSMDSETKSLRSEIILLDSANKSLRSEIAIVWAANARKDSTIAVVVDNYTKTHAVAVDALKPPTFWQRPGTWGVVGLIVGFLIAK